MNKTKVGCLQRMVIEKNSQQTLIEQDELASTQSFQDFFPHIPALAMQSSIIIRIIAASLRFRLLQFHLAFSCHVQPQARVLIHCRLFQ
jgi:hypothetical protein